MVDIHKMSQDSIRAVLSSSAGTPQTFTRKEAIMGGHGTITIVGGNSDILDASWKYAHRCEELWSRFLDTSEITQLNLAQGIAVEVSSETFHLVTQMLHGNKLSEGYFNPTLLPDVVRAGYAASQVDPAHITLLPENARSAGNMEGIVFDDSTIILPAGMVLDPGGIGKGTAADLVATFARDAGAWGVMVELGGDIVVQGTAPDGHSWKLGVEDPFNPTEHIAIVRLSAGAVATSSQLKKRFNNDKHHLIHGATKTSAVSDVQTATVITGTGAMAEALTKRAFMDKPREYLSWLPTVGAAGMLVLADGSTLTSENWEKYL